MDHDHGDAGRAGKAWIDPTNMTPYQKQQKRVALMSIPRPDQSKSNLYDSEAKKSSTGTSVAALKARCPPHVKKLALPPPHRSLLQMHYVTFAERETLREMEEEMTKEELRWLKRKPIPPVFTGVKKSALRGRCTPRLEVMAMAKLLYLTYNKRNYFDKVPEQQRNALNKHIEEHMEEFRSNHPPESVKIFKLVNGVVIHTSCAGGGDGPMTEKYICELNKAERKLFRRRMKQLGLPKPYAPPNKGPDRGSKKYLKEFEPRLTQIAQPRYNITDDASFNPYAVKPSAKYYVPTERILIMSKPRTIPPPPPFFDFEGNELPPRREWSFASRRRIVANPRTIELATPRFVKKKAAEDSKEDPFAVPRRALTAYCSPRTKELAEPVKRE